MFVVKDGVEQGQVLPCRGSRIHGFTPMAPVCDSAFPIIAYVVYRLIRAVPVIRLTLPFRGR
jgi:hypothetical protein